MKNLKKIVAAFSAAAMLMSLSSVAFASENGSATINAAKDSVSVEWDTLDAVNQWTVIIIDKANENETLEASDLYYINQGTTEDGFWTAMGTKSALTDGDYIVRIGGTNLTGYKDIPLTVSSTPVGVEIKLGDVNCDDDVNGSDVSPIVDHILGVTTLTGRALISADTNDDGDVNGSDITPIIDYILGIGELGTTLYVAE